MSVFKRKGSPHYQYDFTVGGIRFRGSCETNDQQAAKAIEARLRTEAVLNKHLKRSPRLSIDQAFAKYWKEHAQHQRSGLTVTLKAAKQAIAFFGKDTPIDELDNARLNSWVSHLRQQKHGQKQGAEKPLSVGSINRKLDVLSAMLGCARKWGVEVPPVKVSDHKLIAPEARTRWITPAESERLIAAAAPHIQPIIRFALLTGLRLGNILALDWQQVNLPAGIIAVRVKSKLPGGKLLEIPISSACRALLEQQQPKATGAVFTRQFKNGRRPEPLSKVRKAFVSACRQAGINDFRFHDLRHTAASWLVQRAVPLDVVQAILGHSHIAMTQKYAHRQASETLAAMQALAQAQNTPQTERNAA
jgi:integrase